MTVGALPIPDDLLDELADRVADRVAARLASAAPATSPWMTTEEAIEYTRIPRGTFEKRSADGTLPSHDGGVRRRLYHRDELDRALGYSGPPQPRALRGVHAA